MPSRPFRLARFAAVAACALPARDFGALELGVATATRTVAVTNTGSFPLHLGASSVTGSDFTIATDGCAAATVAAGQSCSVELRFKPVTAGARGAMLTITPTGGPSPRTVALKGTGTSTDTPIPPTSHGGTTPPPAPTTA